MMTYKKNIFLLVTSLMLNHTSYSQEQSAEYMKFHQAIYDEVYNHCHSNTWKSAFELGFNSKNMLSSTVGWLTFSSKNNIQKYNQSPAFWQAINDCYNYKSTISGNLKKQLIDMGFLSTQVSSYMIGLAAMLTSAKLYFQASTAAPKVAAAFTSYQISNILSETCKSISSEFATKTLTEEEKNHLSEIEGSLFTETNQIIIEAKKMAKIALDGLYSELQQTTSEVRRDKILRKIQDIETNLEAFDRLENESQSNQKNALKTKPSEKYNICSPNFMKDSIQ